uniref:Sushi, von Willebrand factor type A, EGF and pentraxin domain-containing protein 1 n=1 Tax=Strigamia maritima TaxID=126957 RepID=T1JC55_STRMM
MAALLFLLLFSSFPINLKARCPPPAVPLNARVTISDEGLTTGTQVTFTCDDGYNLFGPTSINCSEDGSWSNTPSFCAINVAYRKPVNQSTSVRGGDASHANDGDMTTLHDNKYCTETRKEISPWWRVDLLRPYEVKIVRVLARKCCGNVKLQDMEIRIGNSTSVQKNRLCGWQPGVMEPGSTKDFQCARPEKGRYVFIQLVGVEGALSLCEVQVFTTQEFPRERCSNESDNMYVATFDQQCYEFQVNKGGNFNTARQYCKNRGGDLTHHITNVTQNFLATEMERLRSRMSQVLLWLGMTKVPGSKVRTWRWVTGQQVVSPLWGDDQPNNYNGEQNCAVYDGGRNWLWNDVGCNLDYLLWICQYGPPSCGSPAANTNTTIESVDTKIGGVVRYKCPYDSRIIGESKQKCLDSGFWSGSPPTCKYVQCGLPNSIDHGQMLLADNRTTYSARALYTCAENYTLSGSSVRKCGKNSEWEGEEPKCMINKCPDPVQILNATLRVVGTQVGSNATYTCHSGHEIIGENTIMCLLGGQWSSGTPSCKYVDCGLPIPLQSGTFFLPDNATTYNSRVTYRCAENHVLRGVVERRCLSNSQWTAEEPTCEIISCGEPDVYLGSYVVGYEFTVGSPVEYFCDPGYIMEGEMNRTCRPSGNWSGQAPKCKYIDCGRVQPIPYAVLEYINDTTHFGSSVSYSCTSGYQLVGTMLRTCQEDKKWDGATPNCKEIRCPEPTRPINSIVSVSGNDRAGTKDSFKIGSTIQYRCKHGFKLEGEALHSQGTFTLPANATYYESTVIYKCEDNYKLVGDNEHSCLETGHWSGAPPVCLEILCGPPDRPPSIDSIEVGHHVAGSVAIYKCTTGQKLTGNGTRICLTTSQWSGGAPECQPVDCDRPSPIENGRSYLVDQTTTYNHIVEYHCFPGYRLVGSSRRICQDDGLWNATDPVCQLDTDNNSIFSNSASAHSDDEISAARSTGIAIGVGSGILLLVFIGVALLYMRTRSPKPLFSSEAPKDGNMVVTYSVASGQNDENQQH